MRSEPLAPASPTLPGKESDGPSSGAMRSVAEDLLCAGNGHARLAARDLPSDLATTLLGAGLEASRARATVSWRSPNRIVDLLGFGEALRLEGARGQSFENARLALDAELTNPMSVRTSRETRPRFFGGGRFQPNGVHADPRWESFGGWRFVLPRFLVAFTQGTAKASVAVLLSGTETLEDLATRLSTDFRTALQSEPNHVMDRPENVGLGPESYERAVATATEEIGRGWYEKVVLARQRVISQREPIDQASVLERLSGRYPNCFVFKFESDTASWIGASPELLVSLQGGEAHAASLAASRPRGATEEADRKLATELMSDHKERDEHQFVVAASKAALEPLSQSLTAPEEPTLLRLPNIQHLYTPITCHVKSQVNILDLVAQMHPTPAVGTWPRGETLATIERLEGMDRGWYAAPIGWVDLNGDGEFAVALRSALVQGNHATLYAGAGIVEESDPESELAETELKLRPLLYALSDD